LAMVLPGLRRPSDCNQWGLTAGSQVLEIFPGYTIFINVRRLVRAVGITSVEC